MREIAEGIFLFNLREPSCNSYFIVGPPHVVVDPGAGGREALEKKLAKLGIKPSEVEVVLNTHSHADHVANNAFFENALVYASKAAVKKMLAKDAEMLMGEIAGREYDAPAEKHISIKGEGMLEFGAREFHCIPTPGHTSCGMCFLEKTTRTLFTGDTLFAGEYGVPRIFPSGGKHALHESLSKLLALSQFVDVLAPGHGPTSDEFEEEARKALSALTRLR
jgi:glyoxylase-like metal-dependent hydrolase (beta-lactamase superfamily II)